MAPLGRNPTPATCPEKEDLATLPALTELECSPPLPTLPLQEQGLLRPETGGKEPSAIERGEEVKRQLQPTHKNPKGERWK
ncbi:UNVERIFIED_CONTAM: hypothetical protein FKN15_040657 [Acipenser sinensis]